MNVQHYWVQLLQLHHPNKRDCLVEVVRVIFHDKNLSRRCNPDPHRGDPTRAPICVPINQHPTATLNQPISMRMLDIMRNHSPTRMGMYPVAVLALVEPLRPPTNALPILSIHLIHGRSSSSNHINNIRLRLDLQMMLQYFLVPCRSRKHRKSRSINYNNISLKSITKLDLPSQCSKPLHLHLRHPHHRIRCYHQPGNSIHLHHELTHNCASLFFSPAPRSKLVA